MPSRLSALQERVLDVLAGLDPPWTLFGAGALIGFHFGHRTSRDLGLAFRPLVALGDIPREVKPGFGSPASRSSTYSGPCRSPDCA